MQSELIRFVYVSQATFKPFSVGADSEIDSYVINILNQSRKNNKNRNLVGALYYGNGCFFQCLEGEKTDIDALYKILLQDPRHKNLEILSSQAIEKIGFSSWEMKYATIDQEVRTFLRKYSLAKFDPYRFTPAMTDELVSTLQQAEDEISTAALEKIAGSLPELPAISEGSIQYGKVLVVALFCAILLAIALYFLV
jgi:hypothetical protein